jgi:hypothetical protein
MELAQKSFVFAVNNAKPSAKLPTDDDDAQ